jgi:hypothetical protein
MVLMAFAHLLPPGRLEQVVNTRLDDIEQQLKAVDSCVEDRGEAGPGVGFAAGFARTVLMAGRDYIEQHRNGLLEALQKPKQ